MQSTLMPINEPNYDSSYVLDFGDELELQLVGEKSSIKKCKYELMAQLILKKLVRFMWLAFH